MGFLLMLLDRRYLSMLIFYAQPAILFNCFEEAVSVVRKSSLEAYLGPESRAQILLQSLWCRAGRQRAPADAGVINRP